MRYLKTYELYDNEYHEYTLFEPIMDDVNDILVDLQDDGIKVDVVFMMSDCKYIQLDMETKETFSGTLIARYIKRLVNYFNSTDKAKLGVNAYYSSTKSKNRVITNGIERFIYNCEKGYYDDLKTVKMYIE